MAVDAGRHAALSRVLWPRCPDRRVGRQALLDRGASLDAALTRLGRLQSNRVDDWHDEEPGSIPYQVRSRPARAPEPQPVSRRTTPITPVRSCTSSRSPTCSHGPAIARAWRRTGTRRAAFSTGRANAATSIGDGYLEYRTRSSKGTKNQGWKDSGDAIVYDDGRPVPAPIATCELQGYWYVAQQLMALLCTVMGARRRRAGVPPRGRRAEGTRSTATGGSRRSDFFALALDPDKRPVRAVTSNVGHCLATGIIERERLPAVVGRLFAPDMFSGWGIRTLSSDARVLRSAELSPRHACGRSSRRRSSSACGGSASTRARSNLTRALFDLARALSGLPDSRMRRRLRARRAPDAGRIPARQHAAALERDHLSARRADAARPRCRWPRPTRW